MKQIALVTYLKSPQLSDSDSLLLKPFHDIGYNAIAVAWDDQKIDWNQFDAIIIRSCWDYHYRVEEFLSWLDTLKGQQLSVFNPISLIKKNYKKKYLKELEKQGIPIVPTEIISNQNTLNEIKNRNNWTDVIIKPLIGATSYKIKRENINHIGNISDVMIQPLMPQIYDGEYSFIFIGGEYTHAVLKTPKRGEFRSNYGFGASEKLIFPNDTLVLQAKKVLATIKEPTLYARVDMINDNNKMILMELELIEPHLFFDLYPKAAKKFAQSFQNLTTLSHI